MWRCLDGDAVLESCAAAYISNRATTEKDEEPDPDLRVLEVMKSNYRPIGKTITITPVESGNLNLNKLVSPWMSA